MKRKIIMLACASVLLLSACSSENDGSVEHEDKVSTSETAGKTEIENVVLYEQDGLKISADGYSENGTFGPSVRLLLENDGSEDVVVQVNECTVNGYMTDTVFSADVMAGKKSKESLVLSRSSLKECGIDTVADIDVSFRIIDASTYMDLASTPMISIPTSLSGSYSQTVDDSGNEIYNSNGIRIVSKGTDQNLFGEGIGLYIDNQSGQDIVVQAWEVSVNGYMTDGTLSCDVLNGTHAVSDLQLYGSSLDDNGIDSLETCDFNLHISSLSTFDTIVDSDPVSLRFE